MFTSSEFPLYPKYMEGIDDLILIDELFVLLLFSKYGPADDFAYDWHQGLLVDYREFEGSAYRDVLRGSCFRC